jgi:aspartate/methionine/tyrosine aminotransferase
VAALTGPQDCVTVMVEEFVAGVALLTGEAFSAHGDRHLRTSYANSQAQLELALERIGAFISEEMLERREGRD